MKVPLKTIANVEGFWKVLENWVKALCQKFKKRLKGKWSDTKNMT